MGNRVDCEDRYQRRGVKGKNNCAQFMEDCRMGMGMGMGMAEDRKDAEDCASTVMLQQPSSSRMRTNYDFEASSSTTPWNSIVAGFVEMGYPSTTVERAIEIYGTKDEEAILEYVLACQVADYSKDSSPEGSVATTQRSDGNEARSPVENPEYEDTSQYPKEEGDLKACLMEMGYAENYVSNALEINGLETPIEQLIDFIEANLHGEDHSGEDYNTEDIKKERNNDNEEDDIIQKFMDKGLAGLEEELYSSKLRKRKLKALDIPKATEKEFDVPKLSQRDFNISKIGSSSGQKKLTLSQQRKLFKNARPKPISEPEQEKTEIDDPGMRGLTGFGLPGTLGRRPRELKPFMEGPPFFYFENVATAPKDVWKTICRHFDGIDVEFVDSKFFSASRRPRGYVHNLPVEGRFQALPIPPMTIHEALPETKKYWPSWDDRVKLNCICTNRGSDVLCQEMREIMNRTHGRPNISEKAYILEQCKKWNLVWVGPNQMAPLEPHEIELLLGFERDHTRGASSRTDRLYCLGNSFQTDTVAYHLSALKPLYSDGIKVLSLFSGIGGAEVALHRVGINLKCVVSVEICPKNRLILTSWWKKTGQTGRLIEKEDVRQLTRDVLEDLVEQTDGFDLIIGGSPCNNISGNNRVSRDGLDGPQSSVFYEFPRILNEVRQIMWARADDRIFNAR